MRTFHKDHTSEWLSNIKENSEAIDVNLGIHNESGKFPMRISTRLSTQRSELALNLRLDLQEIISSFLFDLLFVSFNDQMISDSSSQIEFPVNYNNCHWPRDLDLKDSEFFMLELQKLNNYQKARIV